MFLQKNIIKDVKNGQMELEEVLEVLDCISYYRRTWRNEKEKHLKETSLMTQKKKTEKNRGQQHVARTEKSLPKIKAHTNGRAPKEKMGRQRRIKPPALPIKPTEGKTFAEVLSKIRNWIKPAAEVSIIQKTKGFDVVVVFSTTTTNKGTFCEAVKRLLGEKTLISNLEPKCSLEIGHLDWLTENNGVEEAIKRDCPEVNNDQIGITFSNSQDQKHARVEVAEQYARKGK